MHDRMRPLSPKLLPLPSSPPPNLLQFATGRVTSYQPLDPNLAPISEEEGSLWRHAWAGRAAVLGKLPCFRPMYLTPCHALLFRVCRFVSVWVASTSHPCTPPHPRYAAVRTNSGVAEFVLGERPLPSNRMPASMPTSTSRTQVGGWGGLAAACCLFAGGPGGGCHWFLGACGSAQRAVWAEPSSLLCVCVAGGARRRTPQNEGCLA
jgi:hypothetical protein